VLVNPPADMLAETFYDARPLDVMTVLSLVAAVPE
jgi:hypothetical protein